MLRPPPGCTLFPYTTLFRSNGGPSCSATRRIAAASRARTRRPRSTRSLGSVRDRSEEHTSELQSPYDLVCRLLLEKKNARTEEVAVAGLERGLLHLGLEDVH